MLRSITKKLEIEMLYGKVGYGIVAAVGDLVNGVATTAMADVSGLATFQVPDKEWASGIWAGSENLPVEFYTVGNVLSGSANITKVDLTAKSITLDVATATLPVATQTGGVIIYPKGAFGKSFKGIHSILTTSGSLFGIDNTQYSLFKGNVYDAGNAALSFTKLTLAAARAVEKGLEGSLWVLVNPRTWANLMNDQAALRKYDSSYSSDKVELGSKSIKFYSQNGELEIEPSIYVKEGYAYLLSASDWSRVGSTDVTFKRPGQGDQFFRDMEMYSGYQLRCFTDQSLFCSAVGRSVLISNIKNAN
jgi:hypothetical protein